MDKRLLFLLLLAGANPTMAADIEAGIGKTSRTINNAFSLGLTEELGSFRYHLGIASLGALAYGSDATWALEADDKYPSGTTAHWSPSRNIIELYATISHPVGPVFIDTGAAVYRQTWYQEIVDGKGFAPPKNRYKFTPILGVGVERGKYSAEVMYQRISPDGDFDDGAFKTQTYTMMLKRRF